MGRLFDSKASARASGVLFEETDPDFVVDVNLAGLLVWQADAPTRLTPVFKDVLNSIRALAILCDEEAGCEQDGLRALAGGTIEQVLNLHPAAKLKYEAYKELI